MFLFIATPLGIFFAVLLDKNIRARAIYQSALYMPVVLSLAIVGFIWQLQYAPEQGFINNVLGTDDREGRNARSTGSGDTEHQPWAVLVAASWRHVGYVMVLYLAGLKSVDPTLREAAAIDGANERQTFFRVVFPVLRPINVVVLVITVIESLRAFDIVVRHQQGPQRPRAALGPGHADNIIGEACRVGFGSAMAVVLLLISVGPIICVPDSAPSRRPHDRRREERRPAARSSPSGAASGCGGWRLHVFLIVIALLWLFPLLWAIYTSFRPYGDTAEARLLLDRREPTTSTTTSTPGTRPARRSTSSTRCSSWCRRSSCPVPRLEAWRSPCRASAGASTCPADALHGRQPAARAGHHHAAVPDVPGPAAAGAV